MVVVGLVVMGHRVRCRRGVVGDVGDGHGGGGGDRVVVGGRVDGVLAAVVGYEHVVVGGVVRRRGGDERVRDGRGLDRVDDRMGG